MKLSETALFDLPRVGTVRYVTVLVILVLSAALASFGAAAASANPPAPSGTRCAPNPRAGQELARLSKE